LVGMLAEVPAMLDSLAEARLRAGPLDPADFLLDPEGRWFYLGTDRARPLQEGETDVADAVHWARLVERLLCVDDPDPAGSGSVRGRSAPGVDPDAVSHLLAHARAVLADASGAGRRRIAGESRRGGQAPR